MAWKAAPDGPAFSVPVISVRSRFKSAGGDVRGTFADGSPAVVVKATGLGSATYCGFLPGLSYFRPAIPRRPVDRCSADDSMAHFIPTAFDAGTSALVGSPAAGIVRPVECSEPLVESSVVESPSGGVIPLVN